MQHEVSKYLEDIIESISRIEEYTQAIKQFAEFKTNKMMYDAVQRRLGIIGEAMWKADKLNKNLPIIEKQKIISLRHILIHDYDLIDPAIVWTILQKHLPQLKQETMKILNP